MTDANSKLCFERAIAAPVVGGPRLRPPGCPGDCEPPSFPLDLPPGLLSLSFDRVVKQAGDIPAWRQTLRAALIDLLNIPPEVLEGPAPAFQVVGKTDHDGYTQQRLEFQSFDGQTVIAYLLRPRGGGGQPGPGVLVAHGHGLGARSTIGQIESSDGQKAVARVLAQHGYTVLVPELRTFGEREITAVCDPVGRRAHEIFANFAMETGRPLLSLLLAELMHAYHILAGLEQVDPTRLAMVGFSLGGRLSYMSAVLQPGFKACLVASGIDSYLRVNRGNHHLHDTVIGLLRYADYPDVAGLVAPRPLLLSWGLAEPYPYCVEVRELATHGLVSRIYQMLGQPRNLVLNLHPEGHTYDLPTALDFLDRFV
jgi:dienelactone hydrolase